MVKNLRNKFKNKKGFTLVELIVVIVIILVLAAVLVPSVLRYVEKANQANCKADAATLLVQLQADVADHYASDATRDTDFEFKDIGNVPYGTGEDDSSNTTYYTATVAETDVPDNGVYIGDISSFSYVDGKYSIEWSPADGWGEVIKS